MYTFASLKETISMYVGVTLSSMRSGTVYIQALRSVGLEPVALVPGQKEHIMRRLDGLVLTGGRDINPALYRQERAPETQDPDDKRDETEIRLVKAALHEDIPIFGICRGCQVLNIALGGNLIQHVNEPQVHQQPDKEQPPATHTVSLVPRSKLSSILGTRTATVNSYHHQAVLALGKGLQACASYNSADGKFVVEAIEMPNRQFVLGVQWHPEKDFCSNPESRMIFEAFAKSILDNPKHDN